MFREATLSANPLSNPSGVVTWTREVTAQRCQIVGYAYWLQTPLRAGVMAAKYATDPLRATKGACQIHATMPFEHHNVCICSMMFSVEPGDFHVLMLCHDACSHNPSVTEAFSASFRVANGCAEPEDHETVRRWRKMSGNRCVIHTTVS